MAATENKVISLSSLVPEDYDTVDMEYSGDNVTSITYSRKGQELTTLTLTYDGDNVTNITRL